VYNSANSILGVNYGVDGSLIKKKRQIICHKKHLKKTLIKEYRIDLTYKKRKHKQFGDFVEIFKLYFSFIIGEDAFRFCTRLYFYILKKMLFLE
jgi:hypothetical protein